MDTNLKEIAHVIGIDLGHGETSAAICSLQWDTNVEQLEPVKDLKLAGNNAVIPSAITLLDNGSAFVGESAFNTELLKRAKVHVGFKRKPESIDGEAEKLMIRYMKEVYNRIRSAYAGILTDGNHLVYIATPSEWDRQTKDLYVRMAQTAGLPTPDDGVTSESRAAFVKAQHDATLLLGRAVDSGAIVVDMGSSTLDFTYMNLGEDLEHPIDNGYNCGASHIERTILKKLEADNQSLQLFESKYPELRDFLLFEVRKFKEEVYTKPNERIRKTYNFEDFIDDPELEDERFKISFMPGELDQLLEEEGYIESVRNALVDYRNNFIPDKQINGVLLTGGASRMSFIKKLVCECWQVPDSLVHYDIDPSLTISRGVAEVARMDLRTDGMEDGLEGDLRKLDKNDDIFNTFVDRFSGDFTVYLTEAVNSALNKFASSNVDYSRSDLLDLLKTASNHAAWKAKSNAGDILQAAVETNLRDIEEKVEDIRRHYTQEGMMVDVSYNVSIPKLSEMNLDMSQTINEIIDDILTDNFIVGGMLAGGGLLASLAIPGLGWVVGAGLALKMLFGKSEEEKKKEHMNKKLTQIERQQDKTTILAKLDEQMNETRAKVKEKLSTDMKLKNAVKQCISETLQSYRENLKAARILID